MNEPISVTALNQYVKGLLDRDRLLAGVYVRGEISNYKRYPSGHHYFSLKDAESSIRCVLFRGNAEAAIREAIIERGYIEGIIGLPPNLFYGTGIPVCIIVIDKKDADKREGIFMIDAG